MPEDVRSRPGPRPLRPQYSVDVCGLEHLRGPERKIVYHGVNKSGSLTLTRVLQDAYLSHRRGTEFFSTYVGVPRSNQLMQRLIELSTGPAFFGGHYLYDAYRSEPGEVLFTTQLRNPLPRARSAYNWLVRLDKVGGRSFQDWLPGAAVGHSQTRQFIGDMTPETSKRFQGASPQDLLGEAIARLDRDLAWIGIAEYFEETAFGFAALCGLPSVASWATDDRNAGRPLVDSWDPAEAAVVREAWAHDFALYEWGLSRFRSQLAALEVGPDLDRYRADCLSQYKDRLHPDGAPITRADVEAMWPAGAATPAGTAPGPAAVATRPAATVPGAAVPPAAVPPAAVVIASPEAADPGWHRATSPLPPPAGPAAVQELSHAYLSPFRTGVLRVHQRPDRWLRGAVYDDTGRLVTASQRLGGLGGDRVAAADAGKMRASGDDEVLAGRWLYGGHWMDHFGQFLTETLTTLWPAEQFLQGLVCHRYLSGQRVVHPWQRQLLDLAGRAGLEVRIVGPDPVVVESLVLPERTFASAAWVRPEAVEVWRRVGDAAAPDGDRRPVFLSRSRFHERAPADRVRTSPEWDAELDRAFSAAGFRVVFPETMSVGEQIAATARAEVVAGPAGSALHLSAMGGPTRVIEVGDVRTPTAPIVNQTVINAACGHESAFIPLGAPVADTLRELGLP